MDACLLAGVQFKDMKTLIFAIALSANIIGPVQELSWSKLTDDSWNGVRGNHDPFSSYAPSHAIRALRRAIAFEGDQSIKSAVASGNREQARLIFPVVCWGLQTTMTQPEQTWYCEKVWKLDDCEPTRDWAEVLRAPSLVSSLQTIGDPKDREIYDLLKAGQDRRQKQISLSLEGLRFYDAHAALSSSPMSEPRTLAGVEALKARISRTDLAGDLAKIRSLLQPEQQREWDSILHAFQARLRLATAGQSPWGIR